MHWPSILHLQSFALDVLFEQLDLPRFRGRQDTVGVELYSSLALDGGRGRVPLQHLGGVYSLSLTCPLHPGELVVFVDLGPPITALYFYFKFIELSVLRTLPSGV